MSPGDILLVNYPFDDVAAWKQRPVVVMAVLKDLPDWELIVLQVTSSEKRVRSPALGDIITADPAFAIQPSVIRCRRVFSLKRSQVKRQFGSIHPSVLADARNQLKAILSL